MEKNTFSQLIDRYISGSASEAEQKLVEEYVNRLEAKNNSDLAVEEEQTISQTIWKNIQQKISKQSTPVIAPVRSIRSTFLRISIAAAAACLLLIIILKPWERSTGIPGELVAVVGEGKPILKVMLSDGSLVWLKSNSTLTYPAAFKGNTREIKLKGEALFEISKNPQQPFIVHSSNMDVRVVGTSFNIYDNKNRDSAEIAVLTGKVWVNPAKIKTNKIVLLPKEKLSINKQNGSISRGIFSDAGPYVNGTEYDMHFIKTSVDSIVNRISEKFNVTVLMEQKQNIDCRVNGDFTDQSLSNTITLLCQSLKAAYTIANDTVRISHISCK